MSEQRKGSTPRGKDKRKEKRKEKTLPTEWCRAKGTADLLTLSPCPPLSPLHSLSLSLSLSLFHPVLAPPSFSLSLSLCLSLPPSHLFSFFSLSPLSTHS